MKCASVHSLSSWQAEARQKSGRTPRSGSRDATPRQSLQQQQQQLQQQQQQEIKHSSMYPSDDDEETAGETQDFVLIIGKVKF